MRQDDRGFCIIQDIRQVEEEISMVDKGARACASIHSTDVCRLAQIEQTKSESDGITSFGRKRLRGSVL